MVMKYLQRIGKSLMLPVAVLPVCAILMGLGYAIDTDVMTGLGDVNVVSLFLVKAGGALIDNMGILFAVGVAVGMSVDNHGSAGLAGLVSWLVITTLCSAGTAAGLGLADPAFAKITNQFIGILAGLIGGHCYNFFRNTNLPAALSFFSGRRSVAIVTTGVSCLVSLLLLFVWPFLFTTILVNIGKGMVSLGAFGAMLYGILNRLLIPIGLHHALNSVFWFDVASINDIFTFWTATWVESGTAILDQATNTVITDAGHYVKLVDFATLSEEAKAALTAAGVTSGKVNVLFSQLKEGQAGMYQAGFFPIMMFGLPGAAAAMIYCAKPEKQKATFGLLGAGALASFISGVTEPLEFAFMFLAPVLFAIHAVLTGLSVLIVALLPVRAGFWFSAGLIDYVFSFFTANVQNAWALPLIGIAFAAIYFFVFTFVIKKMNLQTPGREEDSDETKVVLANNDYTKVAEIILEGLGGKENVKTLDNCITRLRLEVKDYTKVDEKVIKSAGISGIVRPSKDAVQVIVGTKVQFVADEMKKML